ncbi:myosin light chain 4 isoform X2 [Lutra lutra]|uniref:myosin light chain 4 isoform X2 n=1 Tax=Lutra lutra TaxID=9657 RepID=UPI001FD57C3E|nr:myosin light chain 4 isoform X2 [Lutra lutra]
MDVKTLICLSFPEHLINMHNKTLLDPHHRSRGEPLELPLPPPGPPSPRRGACPSALGSSQITVGGWGRIHRPRKATWARKSVTKTEIGIKNTDPIGPPPAPGAQKQNQTPPANLPHRYEGGPSSDQRCLPIILWAREHLGRVSGPRPPSLVSHPGRDQAPGLTGGAGQTLARPGKAALSPNRAHTAGGSNAGPEQAHIV